MSNDAKVISPERFAELNPGWPLGFKVFEVGPFHFVAPNETVAWGLFLYQMDEEDLDRDFEEVIELAPDTQVSIWTDENGIAAEPEGRGNTLENLPAIEWARRFVRKNHGMSGLLCVDGSEL